MNGVRLGGLATSTDHCQSVGTAGCRLCFELGFNRPDSGGEKGIGVDSIAGNKGLGLWLLFESDNHT